MTRRTKRREESRRSEERYKRERQVEGHEKEYSKR